MSTIQLSPVRLSTLPTTRGELRLTRRGRLVVFLLGLAVVLGIGLVLAAGSVATPEPGAAEPTTVVTVGTGDTLWEIAADASEDGQVRSMISRIERLNGLDSTVLVAGQQLRVPTE
ncbi:LysM peptidoglycan-binding domain-containing protein [Nocardioides lianchengensis]|uniref:LysM domain-containing protein n=1 Tax=Nocardioides lianchengensis TaxID=1045774 RepID=A0A1G6ZCG5_9ACTN|nr:LysM peptidoglycan-binding domain-containing protein [Nocardioides lianchengensis]NYG11434.1 LysM repeat protein [Nocardioides lianchengensis]SDE00349.1 LysM domain-containing protein [Nocardioides lianchengensis]